MVIYYDGTSNNSTCQTPKLPKKQKNKKTGGIALGFPLL